ncbi:helix-turn-helix domain-containing protein [Arthrobacter sp. NPDC090010]|uniref:helix-turn-helix domain-containing protein n=1 Tax=Arthrobacter sp. NPDC090010 TaxID=3363942 RepID=UPI0037FAF963
MWRVQASATQQSVLPDGVMDIMWFQNRLVFAGPGTRAMTVSTSPGEVTVGLRLPPGVAHTLLQVSAQELVDLNVDLQAVTPHAAALERRFDGDPGKLLEQVLAELWRRAEPDHGLLSLAASLDHSAHQGKRLAEIACAHNMSERSLRRIHDRLFGYGPNSLLQIHRFQKALQLVQDGLALGDAAASAGYFDQAHFTRDAKKLSGRTPARLAAGL